MRRKAFYGYKCPQCSSTVESGPISGTKRVVLCPICNTAMEPNISGRVNAANVYCSDCNSVFGLLNSDKCPHCGSTFLKIK